MMYCKRAAQQEPAMEQRLKVEKKAHRLCLAYAQAKADEKENAAPALPALRSHGGDAREGSRS